MKNLKKYLLAFVLVLVALILVGCGETEQPVVDPEPEQPSEVKISQIEIFPTIYEGDEDDPFVLIDQEIYFEAEKNEDATEVEQWSIDDATVAELKVNEEGGVICVGKKAGKATLTAKNADGTVTDTFTFEVATSKDKTAILVAANDEILAKMPRFLAADTKLPVPDNPCIDIKYTNSITNGIKVENGVYIYAYDASKGDVNKSINFTLTYRGQVLKCTGYFYEVKDANDNIFTTTDKVAEKINDYFKDYIAETDKKTVAENLELPAGYTAEEVGRVVELSWASDKTGSISNAGKYTKPAVDTAVVLTATISIVEGEVKTPVSKHSVTVIAAGYTPEEVINYFQTEKKYCPQDGAVTTSTSVTINSTDPSKKFSGLSVEWSSEDTGISFKQANKAIFLSKGEFTLVGTFYYNKQILNTYFATQDNEVKADKTYYTFNVVDQVYVAVTTPSNDNLASYFEMTETISYAWTRTLEIHITRN